MPDLSPESIAEAATKPASATQDGRTAAAVPIPDQIAADKYQKQADAVEGTNDNGGPRTGWGALRGAIGRPGAGHQ